MTDAQLIERPSQEFGLLLMQMLRDPQIPADKMELVIRARRETMQDEAREAYQFHFAAFTAEMPPVEKDGWVDLGTGRGKYPFTTYEQMDFVLRPLLVKHGFSLQFWSSQAESKDIVLVHGALIGHGWERQSDYPVPPDTGPGRNALQARGSAQSYAKRYIADLLCNIVRKGQDNDGRGAVDNFIDEKQIKEINKLIKDTNTNVEAFLNTMLTDVKSVEDIRGRDFPRLTLALKTKLQNSVRKELGK